MRYSIAVAMVLSVALCAFYGGAAASESGDFLEWAMEQGKACDGSWNAFVQAQPDGSGTSRSYSYPARTSHYAAKQIGQGLNEKGSVKLAEMPFLPRSTRDRNGPSRGLTKLQSPASARLRVPYDRLRPARSDMRLGKAFGPRRQVTRPHHMTTHRISSVSAWRRGASRPAYRVSRPRR
jgi:hypothetical protein